MVFKGKVVLITGSSHGIGKEVAYLFAKDGAKVIITYNKYEKDAKDACLECKKLGAKDAILIKLDIRDEKIVFRNA